MPMHMCVLASGSSGNSTYIASDTTRVLVDCGVAAKVVVARLEQHGIDPHTLNGIFITHAHHDHFKAAGTIHRKFDVPVYLPRSTEKAIFARRSNASFCRIKECCKVPARLGDLEISTYSTKHGFGQMRDGRTICYLFRHGNLKMGVATDLGEVSYDIIRGFRGADALVLEANYHEPIIEKKLKDPKWKEFYPYLRWVKGNWGHLTNEQCGEALARIITDRTKHVFLGHISHNHSELSMDNNSWKHAHDTIVGILKARKVRVPEVHQTYRRDRTEGKASEMVTVG